MRVRLFVLLLTLSLLAALVLAPVAGAEGDGRGAYGATDDKAVTNAGFIIIGFFAVFVFLMSMLQMALERRKERRKAAHKALLENGHWPSGW